MSENPHAERAAGWLASVGGSAAPGELGAALGLGHTAQAGVVRALRAAGLASGGKGRISLTPAGWARAGASAGPGAGAALDAAAAGLPYAHRAYLELLCSAVIARHHLAGARPRGHLGFMAMGETGTGKSAVVLLACHLLGLDPAAVQRFLYSETAGSLLGRREQDGEGFRLVASETAGLPLLLLDEFDKGEESVRRAGWAFFQGETTVRHEGQSWPVRPVPVLAANPPAKGERYGLLRPEYRRRCAVLDTGYMRGRQQEIEDMLIRYYQHARPGGLCLDRLAPPADRLDARGLAVLRTVRGALTEAGREEFPGIEALELAALGRLALTAGSDHALAAYATGLAYLQVTETLPGQVAGGWQLDMTAVRTWLGQEAAGTLAEAVERGRAGREQATATARAVLTERAVLGDELTATRGQLAGRLELAAAAIQPRRLGPLDDARKAEAAGVRAVLAKLRREVQECRSAERLAELEGRAARPLAGAAQLAALAAAERERRERDKQTAEVARRERAQAAAEARKAQSAYHRQATAQWRTQLQEIIAQARKLERYYTRTVTRPGESPLTTLHSLRVNGRPLLTYQPRTRQQPGSRLSRVLGSQGAGDWCVTGSAVSFPGWPGACRALARWGEGTRAVLAPALTALYQAEDQLSAQLDQPIRTGRPAVALPAAGLPAAVARRQMAPLPGWRG